MKIEGNQKELDAMVEFHYLQPFLPTHSVLSLRWWLVLGCAFP